MFLFIFSICRFKVFIPRHGSKTAEHAVTWHIPLAAVFHKMHVWTRPSPKYFQRFFILLGLLKTLTEPFGGHTNNPVHSEALQSERTISGNFSGVILPV